MKRILASFLLVSILVAVGAGLWFRGAIGADRRAEGVPAVLVEIPVGSGLNAAARRMVAAGVLKDDLPLRLLGRIRGEATSIQAGSYRIEPGTPPRELLRKLVDGDVALRRFTFPEGWSLKRLAAVAQDSLGLSADRVLELAVDPALRWREAFDLPEGHGLEGYLLPETYFLPWGLDESALLDEFASAMEEVLTDEWRARADSLGLGVHGLLTLASIVESEAVHDDERPQVAAVYHNRLRRGWRLEADPTVAYALDKQGERLLYRDLQVDSPYNTYRNEGLPPGPINNPGRASIEASLWPRESFEAVYFVADGTGGHIFSNTWDEHQRAVKRYRALMRERRGP